MKRAGTYFLISLVTVLLSCSKKTSENEVVTSLVPNYGNVDLKNVFTKEDNQLQDREFTKNVLEDYYSTVWENGNLSGSILVAKGDDILLEKYRGFSQDGEQSPITKETSLHVASVSKTMTAMAVMKLVEAGKVKLSDDLQTIFPGFPYQGIQVLHLLNQRSGLPKYEYFIDKISPKPQELSKEFITNQDVLSLIIKYKPELARTTDTGFMYCNTNYALLALVVEKVTKMPFPKAMQEILFKPLGMKNSYIFTEKDLATAARSFYNGGNRLYPYDHLDLIFGDKNVYTTPRDLFNFSKAMFSADFLKDNLKDMVFEPYSNEKAGVNNYGLGFRMKIYDNGEKLTYHNGWWHGSNTVFGHLLKSKVTIIALGNKYSTRVYTALALSGLFENFPIEAEKLAKVMSKSDSSKLDSAESVGE